MKTNNRMTGYAWQLRQWTQNLRGGRGDQLLSSLAPGSRLDGVRLFMNTLRSKRLENLQRELDFLAEGFANLSDLLQTYVAEASPAAQDKDRADTRLFLSWLEKHQPLSPVQGDYVACQRARLAVQERVRRHRRTHLRFHELWSKRQRVVKPSKNRGQRLHVNPMRQRSRFKTSALLGKGVSLPAEVLTFAVGAELRSAVLEPSGCKLLQQLAEAAPCTVDAWVAAVSRAARNERLDLLHHLVRLGLAALN